MPEYPRKPFRKVGISITPEVSGDTLNGTPIGTVTPAAGNFTTLTSSAHVCEKIALPVPTISGWTTNPSPLSEITNDNYETFDIEGAITTAGAWGFLNFDLGEIYTLSLAVYTDIANTDMIKIYLSLDDIAYFTMTIDDVIEAIGGNAKIINVAGTGRYVRIKYHNLSTGTLTLSNCSVSAIGAPIA